MANSFITAENVTSLFNYSPNTGVLSWKPRIWSGDITPTQKMWDARFANKPIGAFHNGYLRFGYDHRLYLVHRVVWLFHYGEWPDVVDHIDGDRLNNRIENLRSVDRNGNALNRRRPKSNTSGVIGVSWCKRSQKWAASIRKNNRSRHIGYYADIADAAKARRNAEALYGFHTNHGHCNDSARKA